MKTGELSSVAEGGPHIVAALDAYRDSHPPYGLISPVDDTPLTAFDGAALGIRFPAEPFEMLAQAIHHTAQAYFRREGFIEAVDATTYAERARNGNPAYRAVSSGAEYGTTIATSMLRKIPMAFYEAGATRPSPEDLADCAQRSVWTAQRFAKNDNTIGLWLERIYGLVYYPPDEIERGTGLEPKNFELMATDDGPQIVAEDFEAVLKQVRARYSLSQKKCPMVQMKMPDGSLPLGSVWQRAAEIAAEAPELFPAEIEQLWPQTSETPATAD